MPGATKTVTQVFASKKLWAWFNSPVTNKYDGVTEKGEDFATTFGTPVCVPVGGKVLRITPHTNSIGDIVELQDADGAVWLYQHITATVKVGDVLSCADAVGTENGLPIDQYSTGPHIEVRYAAPGTWKATLDSWYEPWVNPSGVFSAVGNQTAGATGRQGPGGAKRGNLPSSTSLAPNADVTQLLFTLDQVLELTNPFDVAGAQQDSIAGLTFTDPVDWVEKFGFNVVEDLIALLLRSIFIVVGVVILIKVISGFINFGQVAQTAQSGLGLAGAFI